MINMTTTKYTIGVDYGTDSVRSLIVNVQTGEELASAVLNIRAGRRDYIVIPPKTSSGNILRITSRGLNVPLKKL